jgi:hypothetical protein
MNAAPPIHEAGQRWLDLAIDENAAGARVEDGGGKTPT